MFLLIGRSIHWIRSEWYLPRIMESWLRALRALFVFSWSQATVSYYSSSSRSTAAAISLTKMIRYARTIANIDQVLTDRRRNKFVRAIVLLKKRMILRRGRK